MNTIPESFSRRTREVHGAAGEAWLRKLPRHLERWLEAWSLSPGRILAPVSYNLVLEAHTAAGEAVALKLGCPGEVFTNEVKALSIFDGHGCVRLLNAAPEDGLMVIELLKPGVELVTVADDEASTRIAATVMQKLWRPVPGGHTFPDTARWATGIEQLRDEFDGGCGPFPRRLVEAAEYLFAQLLASSDKAVLLHGDLHHYNILSATRAPWLAIDPQGVVGEPIYETGAWMRNPLPQVTSRRDLHTLLDRRAAILAEMLSADKRRILGWGMAQAVLSAWWSYDEEDILAEGMLGLAQVLLDLYKA